MLNKQPISNISTTQLVLGQLVDSLPGTSWGLLVGQLPKLSQSCAPTGEPCDSWGTAVHQMGQLDSVGRTDAAYSVL